MATITTGGEGPAEAVPARLTLTAADVADLAERLETYQAYFAPLFQRAEQRTWAQVYLRGLLTAEVPRKNVEAMALHRLGAYRGTGPFPGLLRPHARFTNHGHQD